MNVTISPSILSGTIVAPPSKSQAHRLFICAAFANVPTIIHCGPVGQDVEATIHCLQSLGASISCHNDIYSVHPICHAKDCILDVGESGSTLRFLLPIICALGVTCTIHLHGKLSQRPLAPLCTELRRHGAVLTQNEDTILVSGRLIGNEYSMAGNISSQFLSGIALALPLLGGGTINIDGAIASLSYLHMTLNVLEQFGINAKLVGNTICIDGTFTSPGSCCVEGDWSNAAFWFCANALGNYITVEGLNSNSFQGDHIIRDVLGQKQIDCNQIPDLIPPLAILAAFSSEETLFYHASRLRMKESDRITSCMEMINSIGGHAVITTDGFIVSGASILPGGTINCYNDHRIAMAAAIAGTKCPIKIMNAFVVKKSYATFWDDYCHLGGNIIWGM